MGKPKDSFQKIQMPDKNINRETRINAVINFFMETMPEPATELSYEDPYELIVSVILSAQCTDKRVNLDYARVVQKVSNP